MLTRPIVDWPVLCFCLGCFKTCLTRNGAYLSLLCFCRERMAVVPYDARFRGCYNDKITHVITLHHAGVLFKALPNAWVVHRPHALNPAAAIAKAVIGSSTSQHGVGVLQEVGGHCKA